MNEDIELRLQYLVGNAVDYALKARESRRPDGTLDTELFSGLIVDALTETLIWPLLQS